MKDKSSVQDTLLNTILLLFALCSLCMAGLFTSGCQVEQTSGDEFFVYEKAQVERVVDGDTLILEVGGKSERCRLIGIDCPEMDTEEGKAATQFVKSLVTPGQYVYLEKDISDVDKYDRLLRYVWLDLPTSDSLEELESKMLNGILVKQGHANVKRYEPDTKYHKAFKALQTHGA